MASRAAFAAASSSSMHEELTMRKGPWLEEEDERLIAFITIMGERRWDSIARVSGLGRSGKSCRLRWLNYLRPDLKHGQISAEEECVILQLQERWGNKWSKIARRLPGRTDNEIKNYWRTHLRKKTQAQEQEKLQHRDMETAVSTPDDQSIQTNSSSEYLDSGMEMEDTMVASSEDTGNVLGSSDYGFVASPYENRIYDWISETIHNQGDLKYHEDYDSWLHNQPNTSAGDGDCWTGLLWDMQ